MKWNSKNVLVTGATGMLGGHLARRLVKHGAHVVTIMRDIVPSCYLRLEKIEEDVSFVRGSLEDYASVERALNEYEIEVVFHLGAQTIVGTAHRSPLSTFESNIKGTWNVLEASRHCQLVKSLVVASTDKVYGESAKLPYKEDYPLLASNPYDVSKACADMLCRSYFHSYNIPIGITRCGNIFGEGDLNFNRIVPGTIRSLLKEERPVIRSDGKMVRDYVYVEDIVSANILLAEELLLGRQRGEAFNFSYSSPMTVLQVVEKITHAMGSNLKPIVQNKVENEIRTQYLSCEKAKKALNWKASFDFDLGLENTISWYKKLLAR